MTSAESSLAGRPLLATKLHAPAIWEFSFGIYMIVKGFTTTAADHTTSVPANSPSLVTVNA